ncbi:hypothetical protein D3C74_49190 [compost metagenome]
MSEFGHINEKSNKPEIFKAFKAIQQQLREVQGYGDTKTNLVAKAKEDAVNLAKSLSQADVENVIGSLRKELNGLLGSLSVNITDELEKFSQVKEAIANQEARLKELFDIEETAFALEALVKAKEQASNDIDARNQARTQAAEEDLEKLQQKIKEARENWVAEIEGMRKETELKRTRDAEQYTYDFERQKKQAQDNLADELTRARKVFNLEMEAERNEVEASVKALDQREEQLTAREKNIESLEEQVASIPDVVAAAVKKEVGRETGILTSRFENEKKLIKAEYDAETKVLTNQLITSDAQLAKAQAEIQSLRDQLAKATENVKDLAVQTVNASSDSKLAASLSRTVSELSANKPVK